MRLTCALVLIILTQVLATPCKNKKSNLKLVCYYSDVSEIDICKCTHIVLPSNTNISTIEYVKETFREGKTLLTVNEFNQNLIDILNKKAVDGVDINLKKLSDISDVGDFISTIKSKLNPDLLIAVSVPSKPEVLAKFYNLKDLSKHAEFFILQTAFLASPHNVAFHPSRLSGIWDTQNTDSVVDLVHGLGAPLSKIVISAPVQAFQFTLQNASNNIAGSPALDIKSISRNQFCKRINSEKNWILERDQDQTGPYIFLKNDWIAFEDVKSIDIKAKYARVRGLAGLALKDLSQDDDENCKSSLLEAAYNGLTKQARAPRSAVLQSLKQEVSQSSSKPLDAIQISPYRISRVIDVKGNVHSIRQDTRTEFECSRQGYFMHPRSCGRFYRCVKFDQLSDDFNVFEFDCPDGLIFDSKTEVCVWPGSLPHTSACSGSSEIAPVPKSRFICPSEEGYFADPENCRWFFACLDHGKTPLSAYEFRCPFGLMFDQSRLVCEWSWLVKTCSNEEAIKYTKNFDNSQLYSYDGLGNLNIVKLGGFGSAPKLFITNENQGPVEYMLNSFGPVVQPANDIKRSNQADSNTYFGKQSLSSQIDSDSKLLQIGSNLNYQNGEPFFKTLEIPNQEARVIGGISAVKFPSGNTDIFNTLNAVPLNSVSILSPSPVVAVAAAPVPIIRSDQNTYKFGVVANVPGLQYKVVPNQASGYALNNLGFSSIGNFSQNYNSNLGLLPQSSLLLSKINSLSRNPIYVENYRIRPQLVLEKTIDIQPNVFLSKPNSYSPQDQANYQAQNVGDSSQFQTFYDSNVFNKIISSVPAPIVSSIHVNNNNQGVLEKGSAFGLQGGNVIQPKVLTQVITQTEPLLQSHNNVQTGNTGEQIIKSTLHQQPAVVSSYSYDSRHNDTLIQQNRQVKAKVPEAHQDVVNLGNEENIRRNYANQNSQLKNLNSAGYASVGEEKHAITSGYFYQNVKPQVQQNVDHKVYYGNADQTEAQQIHHLQTQLNAHLNNKANHFERFEHENPAVILEEERPEPVIITNPKPFDSFERKSKLISSDSFQNLHNEGNQQMHTSLPVVQSHATYSQNIHHNAEVHDNSQQDVNVFSGYQYSTPKVNAEFFEISRSTPTVLKQKIAEGIQQVVTHLPVSQSQATYSQNIHHNSAVSSSTHQDENVFSSYKYTPPKANAEFLEIPRSTLTVLKQKISEGNQQVVAHLPVVQSQATYSQNIHHNSAVYGSTHQDENVFSGYQYSTPKTYTEFLEISRLTPTVQERKIDIEKIKPQIAKIQQAIYSTYQTEGNQNYNKEQNVQSSSHAFFNKNHVAKSSLTPVKPLSQDAVSNIGFQKFSARIHQNKNLEPQLEQLKQADLTPNYDYNNNYNIDQAGEERILDNIKEDEYGENYNDNVNFSPQRIQTHGVPAVNIQEEDEDYMDQKSSLQLSQQQLRFASGVKKFVENYDIQNQDYDEEKPINQRTNYFETSTSTPLDIQPITQVFHQTTLPMVKSTIGDDRKQNRNKEKSTFQGYDYSKPSIEFHDGIVEDYKNRQPVQEEPIVTKKAYLTYDNQNTKLSTNNILLETEKTIYIPPTVQFSTALPSFTPEIEPMGEFYYNDNRFQSTLTPSLEPVGTLRTANRIKTGGLAKSTAVPIQTYLPTKAAQGYELEGGSDITITTKSPTTKTYVRIDDVHPLLPAKLEAQCTCTSNPVTLRRKLPTTIPSLMRVISEDFHSTELQEPRRQKLPTTTSPLLSEDFHSTERQEPILSQRKAVVVENYSFQPTTTIIKSTPNPIETISTTYHVPVVVVKKRKITSNQEPTPIEQTINIGKESKIEKFEQNLNGNESAKRSGSLRKSFECQRAGLFRHPEYCNKFYSCIWDCNKNKFNLHVFNCPVHLTFDYNMSACNWPSKGPSCEGNTLLPND